MLFGFGFNKAKVLASAEKNVKQGRLHNAIADYEKILKEDPKDLAIMNTVGDLHARLGHSEVAADYFRKVGDAYASDGFTVKAIAMYKKLTKQTPSALDAVLKLADLYTQQGLYNDARTQYLQVAEIKLRDGKNEAAAEVLQKTLSLDPENTGLQAKLAGIFLKLGRQTEARDLFFRNAEALRERGSLKQADDALDRVLALDGDFGEALQLRGIVKAELGEYECAIQLLEKMPDIDSRPDALRALLRSCLSTGKLPEAEPVARKLLKIFNDPSGVVQYADALMSSGSCEQALEFYREHASRLLVTDSNKVMEALQSALTRIKSSPTALEILIELFQLAGNATYVAEVTELLAHTYAEQGELVRARELYQKLTELEPENPEHAQHYRQIAARVAEQDPSEQLSQVPPNEPAPTPLGEIQPGQDIKTDYAADLAEAVSAALTDAELFESYNQALRAIDPLERILARAPEDVRVNFRLISLYARSGRLKDAAARCDVLANVYNNASYMDDALRFARLAAQYRQQAGVGQVLTMPEPVSADTTTIPSASTRGNVQEDISGPVSDEEAPAILSEGSPGTALNQEIDLSGEWEQMLELERENASPADFDPPVTPGITEFVSELGEASQSGDESNALPAEHSAQDVEAVAEEIRFYISQSMWDEARTAVQRVEQIDPSRPEIAEWKSRVDAGTSAASSDATEIELIELSTDTKTTPESDTAPVGSTTESASRPEPVKFPQPAMVAVPAMNQAITAATDAVPAIQDPLDSFVTDLEASLGDLSLDAPPAGSTFIPDLSEVARDEHSGSLPLEPIPIPVAADTSAFSPALATSASGPFAVDSATSNDEVPGALADIFAEFKESMESAETRDDPETSYNLGVAFKEMGLLDEAIGEFQKVCQSLNRGAAFARAMQAYTWLADCFLQKGVPEAAVRWYGEALKTPMLDGETATGIHYELACAYEAAGDRQAALSHFMQVYGTNIDYRDVAERIKALKS